MSFKRRSNDPNKRLTQPSFQVIFLERWTNQRVADAVLGAFRLRAHGPTPSLAPDELNEAAPPFHSAEWICTGCSRRAPRWMVHNVMSRSSAMAAAAVAMGEKGAKTAV